MGLTKEQFELSLKNPVAFHKYVLGDPMKLTQPQIDILTATSPYLKGLTKSNLKQACALVEQG